MTYAMKSTLFKRFDPKVQVECTGISSTKEVNIRLSTVSGVRLHGLIMANMLKEIMKKDLQNGVYTPEEIFDINNILSFGEFESYSLIMNDRFTTSDKSSH